MYGLSRSTTDHPFQHKHKMALSMYRKNKHVSKLKTKEDTGKDIGFLNLLHERGTGENY